LREFPEGLLDVQQVDYRWGVKSVAMSASSSSESVFRERFGNTFSFD
jgi:hypothetical protein